jgi:hypothetical protein
MCELGGMQNKSGDYVSHLKKYQVLKLATSIMMTLYFMDYSFYAVTEFHFYGANIHDLISSHSLQLTSAEVHVPFALLNIIGGTDEPHNKEKSMYLIN